MATAYDEVPYPGKPRPQTHPDRLAAIGTLLGMTPPPVARCRVLEIGCGEGANLIPMALAYPDSEFAGIDLAARPVASGCAMVQELGLTNIQLRVADLMELATDYGEFDYIIAHGLYSWVPQPVREKLLAVAKASLTPQGIAYISYNAMPGWHLRRMTREMMLYHVRHIADPAQQTAQARALVQFLSESPLLDDVQRGLCKRELDRLNEYHDNHLYHDDLAPVNEPCYFADFAAAAESHGLQYLGEASLLEIRTRVPPEIDAALDALSGGDRIVREQYADFLKLRKFRQTLLCHQEVALDPAPNPQHLKKLYLASAATPTSPEQEKFRTPAGVSVATNQPELKAVLLRLAEAWPQWLPYSDLPASGELAETLLRLALVELIELHSHPHRFVTEIGERPAASPLARLQARDGATVTSLRHAPVNLEDERTRRLLVLMDGTRDREALLRDLPQSPEVTRETVEANVIKMSKLALLWA